MKPSPNDKTPPQLDKRKLFQVAFLAGFIFYYSILFLYLVMGFAGFGSTKNQKVKGNVKMVAKINKPRKYRQYMNRKGGFNRPLDRVN